jgi:hypothetical protein
VLKMAPDPIKSPQAVLYNLQQPEKLSNILAKDKEDDCMACRVTGSSTSPVSPLGLYSSSQVLQHLLALELIVSTLVNRIWRNNVQLY